MQFISYTKIINDALTYPNTALVGLEAKNFFDLLLQTLPSGKT